MAPSEGSYEPLLNGELARLLTAAGIPAEAEQRESGRQMDVVATVDGTRVVLEAETGFGKKRQAIKDADARLKQGLTQLVFAVCYPEDVREETLAGARLTWTLRLPGQQWVEGTVGQLANAVRHAPDSLNDADSVAQQLGEALDGAVKRLSPQTRDALARVLDLPDDGSSTAAKRGMLVVATAMLFHYRLETGSWQHEPRPRDWTDDQWPPQPAGACAHARNVIQAHSRAWRGILEVDYKPVFKTAIVALDALPTSVGTEQMLRNLAETVGDIAVRTTGLRHDLLGRIFHRVLDTARYDGSFYTSTAAATLLAALAIREEDVSWSDIDEIARLRICDPACGTGTLLMAAAERIHALRRRGDQGDEVDEALVSTALVEDVMWGFDTNLTATHMAASTLGMLSPKTQFRTMNVYRALMGVFDGLPYLGSLDFLSGQARLADWPSSTQQVDTEESVPPPPMDLVIMNPPFTRSNLRHDQFTKEEEQAIKAREKEVLAEQPNPAAAELHGSANAFLVLGEKMTKHTGTLSAILPLAMATNPPALETRRYLADQFHIDTIVSSHDPNRIFFSENTKIGEILMVCRRWNSEEPKPPTRFINLAENPSTPLDAETLYNRLNAGPDSAYTVQRIDAERIADGDWYAVNFFSPYLVQEYQKMASSYVRLGDIATIGPAMQAVRYVYKESQVPTSSGRRALWSHRTNVTQSMRAKTDVYIAPREGRERLAEKYWEERSHLLLPIRMRLNTARVDAVMLDERTLGGIWVPCRPHDGEWTTQAALCTWMNSTPGLLAMLGGRDNRIPSYPAFTLTTLRSILVPEMGERPRDALATTFERLKDEPLARFSMMTEDPVRLAIDEAVTEALGLDPEWVAGIRRELAREPSVTNRRWAG